MADPVTIIIATVRLFSDTTKCTVAPIATAERALNKKECGAVIRLYAASLLQERKMFVARAQCLTKKKPEIAV